MAPIIGYWLSTGNPFRGVPPADFCTVQRGAKSDALYSHSIVLGGFVEMS